MREPRPENQDLDPWTLGMLADGERGLLRAVVASLRVRDVVHIVQDSIFRTGAKDDLSEVESAIYDSMVASGSSLRAIARRSRAAISFFRDRAQTLRLLWPLPVLVVTGEGRRALAWHRRHFEPLLARGRSDGLLRLEPRDAAYAAALFGTVRSEMRWADPRMGAGSPEVGARWSALHEYPSNNGGFAPPW